MAGHSKWANIKHKKAKEDAKKGKVFTRIIKEITVAAKQGGGDPAHNPRLRLLLEKARHANMPQENATRAIKKGTGELPGVSYEAITYEGYGPGGIAIIIETLTDNKNRTVADMRSLFGKGGGNLGEENSVSWMFEKKGQIHIPTDGKSEEELLELLLDYDVSDISIADDMATILTDMTALGQVRDFLQDQGFTIKDAELAWIPKNITQLSEEHEEKAYQLLETLDDHDDVQNVYTNAS